MTNKIYAQIGSHYDQEIANCSMWLMTQFLENDGEIMDKITDRIKEAKELAIHNEDEITKYVADFARLGVLAALNAAGQRYMVEQEDYE